MTTIIEANGYPKDIRRLKDIKTTREISPADIKPAAGKTSFVAERSDVTDSVEISGAAKSVLNKMTDAKRLASEVTMSSTLDQSQLDRIRERIDSGYYLGSEVTSAVASRLNDSPVAITDEAETISADPKTAAFEKIYKRMQDGHYLSDEVTGTIADRLTDSEYI